MLLLDKQNRKESHDHILYSNFTTTKHGFVELVVILFTLNKKCSFVIPSEFFPELFSNY